MQHKTKTEPLFGAPERLGLIRTMQFIGAPDGQTFYYRKKHKRVIEAVSVDEYRLRKLPGPSIYAVTDVGGVVRYIGKHENATPVGSRWYRHAFVHHASSRDHIISELDAGRGPLILWTAAVAEIRRLRLPEATRVLGDIQLLKALEAHWINRWRSQLWNKRAEPEMLGFSDGEYWHS